MAGIASLGPLEIASLTVAIIGVVPLLVHYRKRSKWFVAAYGFIIIGAVSTNLENLFLGDAFNFIEHAVGLMGAGVTLAVAGYLRRENVLLVDAEHGDTGGQ